MIDRLKLALQDASDYLRDQAKALGEGARDKGYQVIEEWLQVFPKLEIAGLRMTSFALSVALSPGIDVEMAGSHQDFTRERLKELIAEHRANPALLSVFTTIRTAYNLHQRSLADLEEPLIVKIRVRLSPEIKVYVGKPVIE